MGGATRRKSLGAGAAVLVDISNDDARERRERRQTLARAGANSAKKGKRPGVNYDFSSVMTMCSTNKVNLKNSWSLDLIDHIDDVLDQHEGSFQTASCTLQASVQIYEKRVDSTHQDTFKMLENVNRTRVGTANDAEESRETRRKAGASGGAVSTFLESNLANITFQRSVEREYEVDPLFRKMSKTFDAGGARGLLLNHLRVHGGPRVIFDTSETVAFPPLGQEDRDPAARDEADDRQLEVDMDPANIAPVCPSLELLHRSLRAAGGGDKEEEEEVQDPAESSDAADNDGGEVVEEPADSPNNLEGDNDDDDEGFVYDNDWMMGDDAMPDEFEVGAESESRSEFGDASAVNPLASAGRGRSGQRAPHEGIDFAQFDAYSFFKNNAPAGAASNANWAGPTHWRFGRKRDAPQGTRSRAPRTSKKAFFINFNAPEWAQEDPDDDDGSAQEEVAPAEQAARPASISLSKKTQQTARASDLPQDLHYTVQDLCKLFLKPVVISEILRRGERRRSSGFGVGSDGIASDGNVDDHGDAGYFDDFDDAGYDDAGPGDSLQDDDDDDFVQPAHVLEKIEVDYARKAKRIDVKKLKETIWTEIEDRHEAAADKQISFSESIKHLAPKIDNAQVTVPFYFISLLHLANENNLELQGNETLSDLLIDAAALAEVDEL